MPLRNYTRWTTHTRADLTSFLQADILGARYELMVDPGAGTVTLSVFDDARPMSPDEARMLGVRLIEGAALADGERAIRAAP